jgi:hypothetical protein
LTAIGLSLVVVVMVGVTGCLTELTNAEGKRCTSTCPDNLLCVDGFCRASRPSPDAGDGGSSDAGALDAGATDAGTSDAGPPDAGTVDAGPFDAGAPIVLFMDGCELLPGSYQRLNSTQVMTTPNARPDGGAFACKASSEGTPGVLFGVEVQLPIGFLPRGKCCASVSVNRGLPTEPAPVVSLVLETLRANMSVIDQSPAGVFDPDAGVGFRSIAAEVANDPSTASALKLRLSAVFSSRATFLFDDVVVSLVAPDGGCPH